MSRSSSVGDLVPKDITEVLALQNKVVKGNKKRGTSLGRAFSWLKGNKQKRSVSNGESRSRSQARRTGECATVRQGQVDHDSSKVGQKQDEQKKLTVHYTASQHYQENVFIEGSRPKYLEDLHNEAREGLKILQQEEQISGTDFKDDETVSTVSPQQEKDASCQERDGHLDFGSTTDHSITSASSRPAMSSRPVCQGSTFKPLNTVKKLEKTRRRARRTTIMGIPQHVQRELCMGRRVLLQLPNGDNDSSPGTVIIPTIDGGAPITNHEGARVHLQDIEALQAFRDEQLLRHHIQAVYRDDLVLNRKFGPQMSPLQRPKSLAVPGLTTFSFLQDPQGPVMSISPQATYLSTIIPNAVLPPAIDVIEIDRSRHRRSIRTVSKSSLTSASPGSSCSGGGTLEAPAFSTQWSHSQSSETIISNSSTVSFRGNTPTSHVTDSMKDETDLNHEEQISPKSSSSCLSTSSKAASHKPEQREKNEESNSRFSRSLSITKAKLPPAPPRRTYSLHQQKLKQRSREVVSRKDLNNSESSGGRINGDDNVKKELTPLTTEKSSTHSSVTADLDDSQSSLTSSPQSPNQNSTDTQTESGNASPQSKFERTMSPSSGYSSQSGTPTHLSKDICPPSPGKHKVKPPKPERMGARTSPVVSVSSSVNSLSSAPTEQAHLSAQNHTTQSQPPEVCPSIRTEKKPSGSALRELFNIPPPPKVKAPCPPPPETWAHNKRTVELLCGTKSYSHRLQELQKQQKDNALIKNQDKDHSDQISLDRPALVAIKTPESKLEDREANVEKNNKSKLLRKQVFSDETLASGPTESSLIYEKEKESHPERETASCTNQNQERKILENLKTKQESPICSETVPSDKTDQRPLSVTHQLNSVIITNAVLVNGILTPKTKGTDTNDQHPIKVCSEEICATENPDVESPRGTGNSPPPSPPPAHHPPPPPSKKSQSSSVSVPLAEDFQPDTEKENTILECSWPPPPPPMDESIDSLFEGQDEIDFPPPPPPLIPETISKMSEDCNMVSTGPANQEQHNPELQVSLSTKTFEKPQNEQPPAIINTPEISDDKSANQSHIEPQFSENHSQTCPDLVCSKIPAIPDISSQSQAVTCEALPEKTPPPLPKDPLNSPTMPCRNLSQQASEVLALATDVPTSPPLSMEDQSSVNFRRQSSLTCKDNKSKELLSRYKSAPIPKEDANIPLVTPSLLQMVRLRSVNVEDQVDALSLDGKADTEVIPSQDRETVSQVTPQKPIRKSCLRSTQPSGGPKSSPAVIIAPSMRLQEAIRMKTAAMSSSGSSARFSPHLPTPITNITDTVPVPSSTTPDICDLQKSPASTASFIFSKSTKKVVIETPTSPEVQATLKQNLAAELMHISDQAKPPGTNETRKHVKVPPPVAKKPAHITNLPDKLETATIISLERSVIKQKNGLENGQIEVVQPAGQRAQSPENKMPASETETASTLEVS